MVLKFEWGIHGAKGESVTVRFVYSFDSWTGQVPYQSSVIGQERQDRLVALLNHLAPRDVSFIWSSTALCYEYGT